MSVTLGLVANVYNEINALPGWLETHLPYFDDVRVLHAGPRGEFSTDGTIELLEKWRVPVEYCAIDEGFGAVRTKALQMSPCDWVIILDADERFYPVHRVMACYGQSTPGQEVDSILRSYDLRNTDKQPDWDYISKLGANLTVEAGEVYNQGKWLRDNLANNHVVYSIRRHWHDFSFQHPTQNWYTEPDWQGRIVRKSSDIYFHPDTKMHERLVGAQFFFRADMERGPFFDHFHFPFKRMEIDQRKHDVAIYDSIHESRQVPTLEEFNSASLSTIR